MMSDDFKRQLQDYADGKLTGRDKEQFELELEKMEAYQAFLGELMGNDEDRHPLIEGSAYKASTPIKEASCCAEVSGGKNSNCLDCYWNLDHVYPHQCDIDWTFLWIGQAIKSIPGCCVICDCPHPS